MAIDDTDIEIAQAIIDGALPAGDVEEFDPDADGLEEGPEARGLSDDDMLRLVKDEIRTAIGYDDDEVSDARSKALDYYFTAPRGDEVEGRSAVQSSICTARPSSAKKRAMANASNRSS